MRRFLPSNGVVSHGQYARILALGLFDAAITLPVGVLTLVIDVMGTPVPFWPGWAAIHNNWGPILIPADVWTSDLWSHFEGRWTQWVNVLYSIVFFALFGMTGEARACYKKAFWRVARSLGMKQPVSPEMSDVVFQSRHDGLAQDKQR